MGGIEDTSFLNEFTHMIHCLQILKKVLSLAVKDVMQKYVNTTVPHCRVSYQSIIPDPAALQLWFASVALCPSRSSRRRPTVSICDGVQRQKSILLDIYHKITWEFINVLLKNNKFQFQIPISNFEQNFFCEPIHFVLVFKSVDDISTDIALHIM